MSCGSSFSGPPSSPSGRCSGSHGDYEPMPRAARSPSEQGNRKQWNETMSSTAIPLDVAAAEDHLMRFLSVEGVTGQEAAIAAAVSDALKAAGVPASAIRFD